MGYTIWEGSQPRTNVADVLRGFAMMGIVLLHSIEHFNFCNYPPTDEQSLFLDFADRAIWDGLYFAFGGKVYAIFALLFGFSFFVQDNNQRLRGKDFRPRFVWRLLILCGIGVISALFYTGEMLVLFAAIGIVLVFTSRFPNKLLMFLAVVCLLQPVEWGKMVYAYLYPDYTPITEMAMTYYGRVFEFQMNGDFIDTAVMNLIDGQLAGFTWAWEHGRIVQTAGLFILGMLMGRKKLFAYSIRNTQSWTVVFAVSLLCFFPLNALREMFPDYIESQPVLISLDNILGSLSNLAFMFVLVSTIILLYYSSKKFCNVLNRMVPYGRMSLTNYLSLSVIGSMLYYNWGLKLSLGITYSFLIGIAIFFLQYMFCWWWMKKHSHGLLEYSWKRATWIGSMP